MAKREKTDKFLQKKPVKVYEAGEQKRRQASHLPVDSDEKADKKAVIAAEKGNSR